MEDRSLSSEVYLKGSTLKTVDAERTKKCENNTRALNRGDSKSKDFVILHVVGVSEELRSTDDIMDCRCWELGVFPILRFSKIVPQLFSRS